MRAKMSGATKLECLSLSTEPHTQKKVKRVLRVVPLHLIWRSENSFKGGSGDFLRSSGSKVAPSSSGSRRVLITRMRELTKEQTILWNYCVIAGIKPHDVQKNFVFKQGDREVASDGQLESWHRGYRKNTLRSLASRRKGSTRTTYTVVPRDYNPKR